MESIEVRASIMPYSVLMSVYNKEKPEYLQASMESMFDQTVPPDDFVLVCDGPLTEELDGVIRQMQARHTSLNVLRLKENSGLGRALNIGLGYCKNELVARMDSDDISFPDRCERQMDYMIEHPDVSVLSGTVLEFCQTTESITGQRRLPETDEELKAFSHRRCPFNHPAVMFRKDDVKAVGGYQEKYPKFEDYYLWVRMFLKGNKGHNMEAPVLYMRVHDNLYMRRGGGTYTRNLLAFHRWMWLSGWTSFADFVFGAVPHAVVCVLPNGVRKRVYQMLHKG